MGASVPHWASTWCRLYMPGSSVSVYIAVAYISHIYTCPFLHSHNSSSKYFHYYVIDGKTGGS